MRVLLDTNVILDLLLEREPSQAIAEAGADGRVEAHVCASAITDIYYISRKLVGADKAKAVVRQCLDVFQVVSVTRELLDLAERRCGSDYEDALQVACAEDARLDAIVTRDPSGFAGSAIAVLSPSELLAQLPKAPDSERDPPHAGSPAS